jgi:hypothetical protein
MLHASIRTIERLAMTHVTHPKLHVAPRRRAVAVPRTRTRGRSLAAPLTLAGIVVAAPLTAIAVAIAGALGA